MAIETQEQLAQEFAQQNQPTGTPADAGTAPETQEQLAAAFQQQSQTPPKNAYDDLGDIIKGGGQELGNMVKGLPLAATTLGPAVENGYDAAFKMLPPVIKAYESARAQGKSITDALSDSNDEAGRQEDARDLFKQRAKEFADNPNAATGKTIVDLLALIAPSAVEGLAGAGAEAGAAGEAASADIAPTVEPTAPAPSTLRPGFTQVADTDIPVRAQGAIAKAAESVVDPSTLKEFEVNQTQPAVRQAAGNIAADAADTEAPTETPDKSDAFGFGDAADQVKARAQAGFSKLDDLSGGKFSEAQNEADLARSSLDFEGKKAYQTAINKQNALFDQYKNQFPDGDLDQLKADWRQKSGLDELATRFNRSVGPTPAELTTKGQADLGYVNPTTFRNAIIDASQNGEFEKAGFTPEHVQSLEDLGRVLEKAKVTTGLNATLGSIAKYLGRRAVGSAVGGAIGGVPGAILGAVAEHGGEWLAGKVLGKIMTDPPAVRTLTVGLATGANPNTVGKAVAAKLTKPVTKPVEVQAEPAGADTGTTVDASDVNPDAPPDISALSGSSDASTVDALSKEPADDTANMAGPRDYLDNPAAQAAMEKLYGDAQSSFNAPMQGLGADHTEHLIALKDGTTLMSTKSAPGDRLSTKTAVPDEADSIMHTHPSSGTMVPSPKDYETATQLGKPNFVMSRNAIYVAMPNQDPNTKNHTKVADVKTMKGGKLQINWK